MDLRVAMFQWIYPILDFFGSPILFVLFISLFVLESRAALRARNVARKERIWTNAGVAIFGLIALRFALIPAMMGAAYWAENFGFGFFHILPWPAIAKIVLVFFLLDYGNYLWHRLNHIIPFLWRFHNVHHIDLDLDITTGFRFHYGENLLSAFFRGFIVLLLGAPAALVLIYEIIFDAATLFHHSNWRLPFRLEQFLSWIIVTPRMHGIHHSIVQREANSNYSVIFSFWDRIHRSIRLNIPQDDINIGVPSYRDLREQNLKNLLIMPFRKQRPWQLPNGEVPDREEKAGTDFLSP